MPLAWRSSLLHPVLPIFLSLAFAQTAATQTAGETLGPINWAQPPIGCAEEMIPVFPDRPCLDLTQVAHPTTDWPSDLSIADQVYWITTKRPIEYCRAKEVLRREKLSPGSQSAALTEISWMQVKAPEHFNEKVAAVYEASARHGVPTQILTGALYQESMFSELGIAEDGGNFSCGVGQVNIQEWCHWANALPATEKAAIGWPGGLATCEGIQPSVLRPFYAIALTKLQGLPVYQMSSQQFAGIELNQVQAALPVSPVLDAATLFSAATSFIANCSLPRSGILAKANELALLYHDFVPRGLKAFDAYPSGEHFRRHCRAGNAIGSKPLALGWLMAVGTYNAGPRAIDALAYYQQWTYEQMSQPETFVDLTAPEIVRSLYWSGRYSTATDKIDFLTMSQTPTSWLWQKPCILQRHLARVIEHVTLPGVSSLVESQEGDFGCKVSTFDNSGHLLKSGVPTVRQESSGFKISTRLSFII